MNMTHACIVTDSSVQFPQPNFIGKDLVHVIDLSINFRGQIYTTKSLTNLRSLPKFADNGLNSALHPPMISEFSNLFSKLCNYYDDVIGIFLSSELNECYQNALEASKSIRGGKNIKIFDSKTISLGLGVLVQYTAELITKGISIEDINQSLRCLIPHTYAVFCITGVSYLHRNGFIDYAQATISEMLGLYPIFTLEDGKLNPLEKVRNYRQMIDYFQEFIDEFEDLSHISLLKSSPPLSSQSRILRDFVQNNYPKATFTEHVLNFPLAILFGPRTHGLIVVEKI